MTIEQIANELIGDMQTIARVGRARTDKWKLRKADLDRLHCEATPELQKRLQEAARELNKALGHFE